MNKRTIEIKVRLNNNEAELLNKHVKKSGLSREAYLRQIIKGLVPKNTPPPDYYSMMKELHKIGNNLNQITRKINSGACNSYNFSEMIAMQRKIYDAIIKLSEEK